MQSAAEPDTFTSISPLKSSSCLHLVYIGKRQEWKETGALRGRPRWPFRLMKEVLYSRNAAFTCMTSQWRVLSWTPPPTSLKESVVEKLRLLLLGLLVLLLLLWWLLRQFDLVGDFFLGLIVEWATLANTMSLYPRSPSPSPPPRTSPLAFTRSDPSDVEIHRLYSFFIIRPFIFLMSCLINFYLRRRYGGVSDEYELGRIKDGHRVTYAPFWSFFIFM